MINSWMHNVDVLKVKSHRTNPLWMNKSDAAHRGLIEGMRVIVSNKHGSVSTEVAYDDTLREGVVAMTHGWGHDQAMNLRVANEYPGVNVNELSPIGPGSYDPLSNQAHMTGIPVEVRPV